MQVINIGVAPDDNTGDPIRVAFDKVNDNFAELLAAVTGMSGVTVSLNFAEMVALQANMPQVVAGGGLAALITAIGVTRKTIQFAGDLTVSADLVVPYNIELLPINGAVIDHGVHSFTYNGSTERWPNARVLTGSGPITFGSPSSLRVEWVGGRADGLISSAAANTAAILAMASSSNASIDLSPGVYYIDGQIGTTASNVSFEGNKTTIRAIPSCTLSGGSYLMGVTGSNVTINNIEFDGNKANQPTNQFGGVIFWQSSKGCTLSNCSVHGFPGVLTGGAIGNGVRVSIASDIKILNNRIYNNNGCGINLLQSCINVLIDGNTILDNTEQGIESEGRNGTDYVNYRNRFITITHNYIDGLVDVSRPSNQNVLVDWSDYVSVSNNICAGTKGQNIEILGSTNVLVSGNTCINGKNGGITVTAEAYGTNGFNSNITISNNTITQTSATYAGNGINLDSSSSTIISGNNIKLLVNHAMRLTDNLNNTSINDNIFQTATLGSGSYGISVYTSLIIGLDITNNKFLSTQTGIVFDAASAGAVREFIVDENRFTGNNVGIAATTSVQFVTGSFSRNMFKGSVAADFYASGAVATSDVLALDNVRSGSIVGISLTGIPTLGTWSVGKMRENDNPAAGGVCKIYMRNGGDTGSMEGVCCNSGVTSEQERKKGPRFDSWPLSRLVRPVGFEPTICV